MLFLNIDELKGLNDLAKEVLDDLDPNKDTSDQDDYEIVDIADV